MLQIRILIAAKQTVWGLVKANLHLGQIRIRKGSRSNPVKECSEKNSHIKLAVLDRI